MPLRPLDVGELLAGAFRFIRTEPLLTLGLAAAVMAVAQGVQLVVDLAAPAPDPSALAAGRTGGFAVPLLAQTASGLVTTVLGAVLTGLLLVVLARAVLGQRIGVGPAWQAAAPRLPGLVGLSLLIGLAVAAIVLVGMVPALVTAATGSGDAMALAFLLLVAALVAAVHLGVVWSLAPAAYVLESIGVIAALARSRELVRGVWWRTFGVLLLTGLMIAVPGIVVTGLFGGFALDSTSAAAATGTALAVVVVSAFAVPFTSGVTGLLYLDRRIRRERFDAELARWAAGPPR